MGYSDDINILGGSVHTVEKNTDPLVVAINEIRPEVNAVNISTWSCLEIRMQDETTVYRLITVPLKGWKSSNILEQR